MNLSFVQHLKELEEEIEANSCVESFGDEDLDKEILNLQSRIAQENEERHLYERRNLLWQTKMEDCSEKQIDYNQTINDLLYQEKELKEELFSVNQEVIRGEAQLEKLMQINSMNDAFYIWYLGPYGTINNFRLGNTAIKPIEPNEINAALGETALVINLIAAKCQVDFKTYNIIPMGSFPKIVKVDDRSKPIFPLYIDQTSWTLFPKRNFNSALTGFMWCINEIGEFVASYDPTMTMPYKINLQESKIGEVSFVYGIEDETWTRGLKFMLSNVKWIIAWYTKHGKSLHATSSATSMI
jgi:beclin 1